MEVDTDPATTSTDDEDDAKPTTQGGKLSLTDSARYAAKWQRELTASKKWMEKFTTTARRCEAAYLDQTDFDSSGPIKGYMGRTNLFWSNVQVVLSAIYGKMPQADVSRKFKDYDDDVARVAGIILQRILNGDIEREYDDTNASMRDAVQDRFIVGLGQVWCRYDVEVTTNPQPVPDPLTGQPQTGPDGQPVTQPVESIENEEAETDYVHWEDFRYSPCRRWRDVRWVARRVYMNKKRLMERFKLDDKQVAMIPMKTSSPAGDTTDKNQDVLRATPFQQAAVWELWDRTDLTVCWYVEGCSFVLDYQPDPLELEDFFPCPMPVVATTLTRSFIPRADYAMAQDLYKELDRINAKLCNLTAAVKAAGVYDKAAAPVQSLMNLNVDNQLVPVDNWSSFVEKGGMKGSVDWLPIEAFVNAITQLTQRKNLLQHDLYEVLGISDIMRGASVASETATAQNLKVQYGGARLSNLQNEVARFVSEVARIRANIVCNLWQPETIIKRSQILRTPDAALAQPAVQMLKDFGTAMFSVEVTADSLAAPDWAAEKEARTEFLGAASNYIMAAAPMVAQAPQAGGFLIKLLQWAAAGFKGAATIEGVLDEAARMMEQQAQQPPQPKPPTPEDNKNTAQAAKYGAEAERTKKEAALIPPIQLPGLPPPGGPGGPGMHPMGPGGPMGPPNGAAPPGGGVMPPLPTAPMPPGQGMPQ